MTPGIDDIISPTQGLRIPAEVDNVFKEMTKASDELFAEYLEHGTPYTVDRFRERLDPLLDADTRILIPLSIEDRLQEGQGILAGFILDELKPWLGLRCARANEAHGTTLSYNVRSVCPKTHDPELMPLKREIIGREVLDKYRKLDFELTEDNIPRCNNCSTRNNVVKHDPNVGFMRYEYVWNNDYEQACKQIERWDRLIRATKPHKVAKIAEYQIKRAEALQMVEQIEREVNAFFFTTRVKGYESIYNKIARVITRFDERTPSDKPPKNDLSIKDWYGAIAVVSRPENIFETYKHILDLESTGRVKNIREVHDHFNPKGTSYWGVVAEGPRSRDGAITYQGLKLSLDYCDLPLELQIMQPAGYDIYTRTHSQYKERMQRKADFLTAQGIPFHGVVGLIESLLKGEN